MNNIGLGLLGPTPEQSQKARSVSKLMEAEQLYEECLILCRQQGNHYNTAAVSYQMGLLKLLWGKPEQAIPLFEESLVMFEGIIREYPNARSNISMCHFYLGQALLKTGRVNDARKNLESAITLDEIMDDFRRVRAAQEMLQKCY